MIEAEQSLVFAEVVNQPFTTLPTCEEELENYRNRKKFEPTANFCAGEILPFYIDDEFIRYQFIREGIPLSTCQPIDVYNCSLPLTENGQTYIAGRIDPRFHNLSSKVALFRKTPQGFIQDRSLPLFNLEDPFLTVIHDEIVFGGVQTSKHPDGRLKGFKTDFYRGASLKSLEWFAESPEGMKDVRPYQLANKVGVFGRPYEAVEDGKTFIKNISHVTVSSLDHLTKQAIGNARLIRNRFPHGQWGGANNARYNSASGVVEVDAHRAQETYGKLRYYSWKFDMYPQTHVVFNHEITAERADFPEGPARTEKLTDVLFTAGEQDGYLYVGVSDAQFGRIYRPKQQTLLVA